MKIARLGHSNTLPRRASPAGLGGSAAIPHVSQLPDVDVTGGLDDGDVLVWDATSGTWIAQAPGAGPGPIADTLVWMPLTTIVGGVPELVWDADGSLIPTLVPI